MPPGDYKKIGIATLVMMTSIFLSRVMGYVRELVIAAVAGADITVDAYRVAFVLPEILNHVLASGFLSVTFIPIFSKYVVNDDDAGAWRIFSIILTAFGAVLAFLIVIGMVFTPHLVPLLALGRSDPDFLEMAVRMTRANVSSAGELPVDHVNVGIEDEGFVVEGPGRRADLGCGEGCRKEQTGERAGQCAGTRFPHERDPGVQGFQILPRRSPSPTCRGT